MDNHNPKYCKKCGKEVNGQFCSECDAQIEIKKDDEYLSLKDNGWQQQLNGYLSSNNFDVWYKGISLSLLILGVLNLIFEPYSGIILLFIGMLIYFFKSLNLIMYLGLIWLIVALYQLYFGLSNINYSYMFVAVINLLFSFHVVFKVKRFREFSIDQVNTKQEIDIDKDKPVDNLWLLVAIMIPGLGTLSGLYYVWKGRKGSWAVLVVGSVIWGFITLILIYNI